MPTYKYFLPLISICPPPGYRLFQSLNLHKIGELLDRPDARIAITRVLQLGDRELACQSDELVFSGGRCESPAADFEIDSPAENNWIEGQQMPYLETVMTIEDDAEFTSQFSPDFYTIYAGPERKSFFSDNALKYGNTVTIYQIEAFGSWVEGYPTCRVDKERDVDVSVILINPFLRPAVVDVTLDGIEGKKRFRIDPQSGRRVSLAEAFGPESDGWSGQVYVSGRNRVVMYVASHSMADPSRITTVEHSNPYRGEPTHVPVTRLVRGNLGPMVQRLFR